MSSEGGEKEPEVKEEAQPEPDAQSAKEEALEDPPAPPSAPPKKRGRPPKSPKKDETSTDSVVLSDAPIVPPPRKQAKRSQDATNNLSERPRGRAPKGKVWGDNGWEELNQDASADKSTTSRFFGVSPLCTINPLRNILVTLVFIWGVEFLSLSLSLSHTYIHTHSLSLLVPGELHFPQVEQGHPQVLRLDDSGWDHHRDRDLRL